MEKKNAISEDLAIKIILDTPKRLFKNVTNKTPASGSAKAVRPKPREKIIAEPEAENPSDIDSTVNESLIAGGEEKAEPEELAKPAEPEEPTEAKKPEPTEAEEPEPAEPEKTTELEEPTKPEEPVLETDSGNFLVTSNMQHESE